MTAIVISLIIGFVGGYIVKSKNYLGLLKAKIVSLFHKP